MLRVLLIAAVAATALAADLPLSCDSKVYCHSDLLHHVMMKRVYEDSKTFVDLPMKHDPDTILAAFDKLLNKTNDPSKEQLKAFVDEHFSSEDELEEWTPPDYSKNPAFLARIRDEKLRTFARNINDIWPTLGRKVKPVVFEKPDHHSLIPISHGFIIPGGRFKEIYYWDTYWIIEGLLICGMHDTARGMIENLIELLTKLGHIPNGSRVYYNERSQPPLLTAMVSLYYRETKDIKFLMENIEHLEKELEYWRQTQFVTFHKNGRSHNLLRYFAPSEGPRPESYYEDYEAAHNLSSDTARQQEFYTDIKSAAESGWDFSSRWFIDDTGDNTGRLQNIHTRDIIPVDLNSIYANALQNVATFHLYLRNYVKAAEYAYRARQLRNSIEQTLWDEQDGIWYDYDILDNKFRKYFYPSNLSPLWMGVVEKGRVRQKSARVLKYLKLSHGLDFPGGIPTSLIQSGQQWDFPNAWPPLVSIVVNALEASGNQQSRRMAFQVAQTWVRACLQGFNKNKQMFEKYDAETPGKFGGGGEYKVQEGFGWSNGVVLEFLNKYGSILTADDSAFLGVDPADDRFSEIVSDS